MSASQQSKLAKAGALVASVLGLAGAIVLLSMMCLTGADVLARYIFNAPIKGAFELVELMMVLLVYLAFPLAILANANIEVELWEPKTVMANKLRLILAALCAAAVFSIFVVELFEHAQKYTKRETVTNSLNIPLKYVAYAAMVGAAACVLFTITTLIDRLKSK
jgi:TRAP-type C4-dicarboxylate transport system permease small subunit